MRIISLLLITILMNIGVDLIAQSTPQEDYLNEPAEDVLLKQFSIGPFFAVKAGINAQQVMDGRKNAVAFNGLPDFGASIYYPYGESNDLAVTCDISYCTYAYTIKGVNQGNEFTSKYSYFSISPYFHFNMFLIGFNFGIPVAADYGAEIDTEDLDPLFEFRLGMLYPLMSDEDGSLNIYLYGGYAFTGLFIDYSKDDPLLPHIPAVAPEKPSNKFNPRPVSLAIGLNYMFNI